MSHGALGGVCGGGQAGGIQEAQVLPKAEGMGH